MKKLLDNIGKFFVELKEEYEGDLRQSVLLVDGSFLLTNNLALIINGVKNKFRNARIVVLAFEDKKEFLKDNFPEVEIVVPGRRIRSGKYQLPIQLLFLLRHKFDFIVLSSLDISLLSVCLAAARCPVFLHNRWLEWYAVRKRSLSDILKGVKSADAQKRKPAKGIKGIMKSIGRAFIILAEMDESSLASRILIEDNGYTEIGHVITAARNAGRTFINPDITILAYESRKEDFINNFPDIKLITVKEGLRRHELARGMYRLRCRRFRHVVLTTLDISPIAISLVFMRTKVLLYNRWHQWWSLRFRNLFGYFSCMLISLLKAPVFIYIFIISGFILLRTNIRLRFVNVK